MKKSNRARRAGVGIAVGVAALATMAFGASSAHAAPQPFANTFDNGFLKTAFPGNGFDVIEPSTPAGNPADPEGDFDDPPASVTGDLNLGTGSSRFPPGCIRRARPWTTSPTASGSASRSSRGRFPGSRSRWSWTPPRPMVVQAEGGVTARSRAESRHSRRISSRSLDVAGDTCTIGDPTQDGATPDAVADMTLTFSTADTAFPNPYDGDLFDVPFHDAGTDYPPLQNGAIAANWPSLPPAQASDRDRRLLADQRADRQPGWPVDRGGPRSSVDQPAAGDASADADHGAEDRAARQEVQEGPEVEEGQVRQEEEEEEEEEVSTSLLE